MGYTLGFRPKRRGFHLSFEEYRQYFSKKPHYKIEKNRALYSNADTGVYCRFYYGNDLQMWWCDDPDARQPDDLLPVAFEVNYFRPHIFGLESEIEVGAFVRHFDLLVGDPQMVMRDGDYSSDGFLQGWNDGNEGIFRLKASMMAEARSSVEAEGILSLPARKIWKHWKWNFACAQRRQALGPDISIPSIAYICRNGEVASATSWINGLPTDLPKADFVILVWGKIDGSTTTIDSKLRLSLVAWPDLDDVLKGYPLQERHLQYRVIRHTKVPAEVASLFQAYPPIDPSRPLMGVGVHDVLDEELVEWYLRGDNSHAVSSVSLLTKLDLPALEGDVDATVRWHG